MPEKIYTDLGERIRQYGGAAVIEVKNGFGPSSESDARQQVLRAQRFVSGLTQDEVEIVGGIFYVKHLFEGEPDVPDSIDVLAQIDEYKETMLVGAARNAMGYLKMEARTHKRVRHREQTSEYAKDYLRLNEHERSLLRKMLRLHELFGKPLELFLNIHEKGYWKEISGFFPDYQIGGDFIRDINGIRGLVMELYTALCVRAYLTEGSVASEVHTRFRYPVQNGTSDIDVLVLANAQRLTETLREMDRAKAARVRFSARFAEKRG